MAGSTKKAVEHPIAGFRREHAVTPEIFMSWVRVHEPRIRPKSDADYLKNIETRHRRPKWEFACAVEKVTGGQITAATVMNEGPKPPLRIAEVKAA